MSTNNSNNPTQKKNILICDDDENLGIMLRGFLRFSNYNVVLASDGKKGLQAIQNNDFDLVVLDMMMPNMDGLQLASYIKNMPDSNLPVIFLTAKNQKDDVISGYKAGASDYIVKPFDSELLLYKIEAILQHSSKSKYTNPSEDEAVISEKSESDANTNNYYLFDSYKFVPQLRELIYLDTKKVVYLTPKETSLLRRFCESEKKLVKKGDLLNSVWGDTSFMSNRSMNVFLVKIRKYFKDSPSITIKSIYKVGYKFSVEGGVTIEEMEN